jgi:hypothetical protein
MSKTDLLRYLQDLFKPQDRFMGEEEEEEESGASDGDGAGEGEGDGKDGEGEGEGDGDNKDGEGDGDGKDGKDGKKEGDDDLEINLDDYEPETRNKDAKEKDGKDGKDGEGEDGDDDDVDEQDRKAINKVIDKRLSPLEARIQAQNDELEVNSYLQGRSEMLKYKPVMLKYMSHPAYKNVPVAAIAAIVSAKDAEKKKKKKERDAQKKVKESKGGGDTTRNNGGGGKPDWSSMPKAQFEAELLKIKSGGK